MMKPPIVPDHVTRPFWEGTSAGKLMYQSCAFCGGAQFPPGPICRACRNATLTWRVSSGAGVVVSFSTVYRAPTDAFAAEAPYILALIDFDEGFRMMMNIRGCAPDRVEISRSVKVVFENYADGIVLPQAVVLEPGC